MRGWILRKNYTNLREAAKFLQLSWREKKRGVSLAAPDFLAQASGSHNAAITAMTLHPVHEPYISDGRDDFRQPERFARSDLKSGDRPLDSKTVSANDRQLQAAETLQAATRRMLARKSFYSVRKQTMASLVIQKSLVKWWVHSKVGDSSVANAALSSSSNNNRLNN